MAEIEVSQLKEEEPEQEVEDGEGADHMVGRAGDTFMPEKLFCQVKQCQAQDLSES